MGERLKIGELARLAGKSVRALHLYEELNLLTPAERSAGGFRLYDRQNLERIHFIDKLQRLGLSLSEIGALIGDWAGSSTAPGAMRGLEAVYREKLTQTRAQIRALRAMEAELVESLRFLEGCHPCERHDDPHAACRSCARPNAADATELIIGISSH